MPRTRARSPSPEPEEATPPPGGTRGRALDASERHKAQAIICFYKMVCKGMKKMKAYAFAAKATNNSEQSVRNYVRLENEHGMDALESRRDNCGPVTRFSPRKKAKIDELMADTEAEPTLTADKLECAYRLLTPVMGLVNDKNGGNNFKLPHTGIRKAMREDGWDI
jgi:hypothetical protein